MKFTQLSNKETEELINKSIPINNFIHNFSSHQIIYQKLLGWLHNNNLKTTDYLKTRKEKLENLLALKFNFAKNYEYKTYAMGMTFDKGEHSPHNDFVLYYSNRGLSIEIHPKFRKDMLLGLIMQLNEVINKNEI